VSINAQRYNRFHARKTHKFQKRNFGKETKMKPNFIGLLTLVAMPMAHAGVDTCDMQKPCVDWTMSKLDSSTCGLGGDCTVEVCMIVDESLDGCSKSDTFSHMCDQTGSDGCALWSDASGLDPVMSGSGSTGSCTSDTGEGVTGQVSGKCEGFSYIKMCQEGVAGQTLYWILKDGSDTTIETQKEYSFTYDAECNADVSCVNNLKRCAGGPNQQLMERTWMFKIPDTTGSCDICGSVDAPVDPPGGSVGDTPLDDVPASSPTSSHGDPHCKYQRFRFILLACRSFSNSAAVFSIYSQDLEERAL
jgi:hypothetical protein